MPRIDLIKVRGGTAAEWTSANPVLDARERGYETDTRKSKHGDGSTAWSDLEYDTADTTATLEDVISNDEVATTKPVFQGGADFGADSGDVPAVITMKGGTGGTQNMVITSTTSGGAITQPTSFGVVSPEFNFTGGQARFGNYGSNTYTGTVASLAAFDSSGNIIETSASSGGGQPPIDGTYADITALIANQNDQEEDYLYLVTDASDDSRINSGAAIYIYEGTTDGDIEDYYLVWKDTSNYRQQIVYLTDFDNPVTEGTNLGFFTSLTGEYIESATAFCETAGTVRELSIDTFKNGVSIMSTELTIDVGETSSLTATTPAVYTNTTIEAGSFISHSITQAPDDAYRAFIIYELSPI